MPPRESSTPPGRPDLHVVASEKLSRVFGAARGEQLFATILAEVGLQRIVSPDDLSLVAEALKRRGGFEATTGVLLDVQALMYRSPA